MVNDFICKFMDNYCWEALTFNDVSLATCYADFLPADTEIRTSFSRNINLNAPFVSAAMDTVTESAMAIAMAKLGGIGVIHKNFTPEQQAEQTASVKQFLNGIIKNPVVFRQDMLVQDVITAKLRNNYTFSGFPILDDNDRLVGLLTGRDIKFLTSLDIPVSQAMSTNLVVGAPDTSILEALDIMQRNRVGKLPLVDKQGKLCGLYSFQDVRSLTKNINPNFNRDPQHRLRVAAAVGPYDYERIAALVAVNVDALILDTAHGHSKGVIETLREIKRRHPQVDVVAGNVCTERRQSAAYGRRGCHQGRYRPRLHLHYPSGRRSGHPSADRSLQRLESGERQHPHHCGWRHRAFR